MVPVVGGLRLVFDAALDGAAWPGPLVGRDAAFGESWCGPLGLLARLEIELGLVSEPTGQTERAAELAQRLTGQSGYWSQSFEADPLATAKQLLATRDLLALWGWAGQPAGDRLDALWRVTAESGAGLPDRLYRVLDRLPNRSVDISSIALLDTVADLPPLWRAVIETLARSGVTIEQRPIAAVETRGDLALARTAGFRPTGDGTLTLVSPQGPLAAAEEVAAALAASASLDGVVIIGAEEVLDAALARHGLPRIGTPRGVVGSAALVRLVLETAFAPMDPDDLHALICADPGPIHARLKRNLVRALNKFPARGSADWEKAVDAGLAAIDDEKRDAVAARFIALVNPVVGRAEALSIDQLAARMRALSTWAHGRALSEPSLRATAMLADRLVTLARLTGGTTFDRTSLRRLTDELELPLLTGAPAEAGLAGVDSPGAIVGAARTIVWWSFTRETAPSPPRIRLSVAERAALLAAGVTPPDPGAMMTAEARRWRRPLDMATEALVLVCPRTDDAGGRAHPHALWDELTAKLVEGGDVAKLEHRHLQLPALARRQPAVLRPLCRPAAEVRTMALALGDPESPSSLESLLGCSLAWALERKGSLWGGLGTAPGAPAPIHYGNIAHKMLEQVFAAPVASPEAAAALAEAVFDGGIGILAEAMQLPDFQHKRAELRRGIVQSAREVGRLIARTGATVRGLELEVSGVLGETNVKGRMDLMLDGPEVIIDFKWGFGTYRALLKSGSAFQLVAYAALTRGAGALPQVGYLTLQRQQLLAPAGTTLPDAQTFSAHTAEDMLAGALARLDGRRRELADGVLHAPSALDDVKEGALVDGVMHIVPRCKYCSLGAVCGRSVRP